MRYIIALVLLSFLNVATLYADTIVMKDKNKLKGLVVEEYVDRIVFSTVEGERDIFRNDIEVIEYDTPEQNFMQLGRSYEEKGLYDKAAFYYRKAIEINPDYKEARDAYLASHAKMWRKEERLARKELERQDMVMNWRRNRNKKDTSPSKDTALLLEDTLGISLRENEGVFTIDKVVPYSSADKAGIKEGDILVGIWGKLIRYSKIQDVIKELLGPKYSEVKVLIEREIPIPVASDSRNLYDELGILLGFEYEGLVVNKVTSGNAGDLAGLRKDDFIVAIDKTITRYLPLDGIIALINSAKNNERIIFTIRRKINLRREGK